MDVALKVNEHVRIGCVRKTTEWRWDDHGPDECVAVYRDDGEVKTYLWIALCKWTAPQDQKNAPINEKAVQDARHADLLALALIDNRRILFPGEIGGRHTVKAPPGMRWVRSPTSLKLVGLEWIA